MPAPNGIPLPDQIAEDIRGTLVGRLQLKLWELITGRKDIAPIYKQILREAAFLEGVEKPPAQA